MKLDRIKKKDVPHFMRIDPVSGTYWYDIYRDDRTPKRLSRSTGESRSLERAVKLAETAISRWLGEDVHTGEDLEIKFAQACDEALADMEERLKLPNDDKRKLRLRTLVNARLYIGKYLRDAFGHLYVSKMSPHEKHGEWAVFAKKYKAEHPGMKLYNHAKHLSIVMAWAVEQGYRKDAWTTADFDPKQKEQRKLTPDEVERLVAHSSGDIKVHIIMGATMGLRLREILRQGWTANECCHVDMENRTLTVCEDHAKTSTSIRTIPLSRQAYTVLLERFTKRKPGARYVFPSPGNPDVPIDQNKTAWRTAKLRADVKGKCKFHLLRHYFLSEAAKLVKVGAESMPMVCKFAGLTMQVFERNYLHMDYRDMAPISEMVAVKLREDDFSVEVKH